MTTLKPNAELAYLVLDQIDAHPETWNQGTWDCGTAACFAGWAVRLSGWLVSTDEGLYQTVIKGPERVMGKDIDEAAEVALGSDCYTNRPPGEETEDLFDASNSREDLGRLVAEIFGPRPASYGSGCSCDYLGEGTPEHTPSALCQSLRPDADRDGES